MYFENKLKTIKTFYVLDKNFKIGIFINWMGLNVVLVPQGELISCCVIACHSAMVSQWR